MKLHILLKIIGHLLASLFKSVIILFMVTKGMLKNYTHDKMKQTDQQRVFTMQIITWGYINNFLPFCKRIKLLTWVLEVVVTSSCWDTFIICNVHQPRPAMRYKLNSCRFDFCIIFHVQTFYIGMTRFST